MADLQGTPPEVSFTLTITRKDSGKVETIDMVGHIVPQKEEVKLEGEDK